MAMKKIRNYEVSIWTLQDSFITVLKHATLENKGQIQLPEIDLIDDGTQEFNFKIPMYYRTLEGLLKENPIWYNTTNGNIIADLRKIKVIINKNGTQLDDSDDENDLGVFEFIITKVTEIHENNVLTCLVHCEGLAFHELGKIGYKILLSTDEFYREDLAVWKILNGNKGEYPQLGQLEIESSSLLMELLLEPKATLSYWNDKIFKRNGKWKYNWLYLINMDWSGYRIGDIARDPHLVYLDSYVSSWGYSLNDDTLTPREVQLSQPKERLVDLKESNIYNLTQDLAETFGVYCKYVYEHDNNYHITKRKVIYYNNFLNEEYGYLDLTYPFNTSSISRLMDAIDVVTKMYIKPVTSETSADGYLTIMNSKANKSRLDYLLNFDYLYGVGAITQLQYDEIEKYLHKIRKLNDILVPLAAEIVDIQLLKVQVDANVTIYKNAIDLDKLRITASDSLLSNLTGGTGILHVTKEKPDSGVLLEDSSTLDGGDYYLKISLKGILPLTLHIYRNYSYMTTTEDRLTGEIKGYFLYDDYNNLIAVRRIYITDDLNSNRRTVYLTYDYLPRLYYLNVKKTWEARLKNDTVKYDLNITRQSKLLLAYNEKQALYDATVLEKENVVHEFLNMMGPALRLGYWMPDDYEDYGDRYTAIFNNGFSLGQKIWDETQGKYKTDAYGDIVYLHGDAKYNDVGGYATIMWDRVPFDGLQLSYYLSGVNEEKRFFPCIKLRPLHLEYIQKHKNISLIFYNQAQNQVFQNIRSFSLDSQCQLGFLTDNNKTFPVLFITGADSFTLEEIKCMQGKGNRYSYSSLSSKIVLTTKVSQLLKIKTLLKESVEVKVKLITTTLIVTQKNGSGEKLNLKKTVTVEKLVWDETDKQYKDDSDSNSEKNIVKTITLVNGSGKIETNIDRYGRSKIKEKITSVLTKGWKPFGDNSGEGILKDYTVITFYYELIAENPGTYNISANEQVVQIWYNTLNAVLYTQKDPTDEQLEQKTKLIGTKTITTNISDNSKTVTTICNYNSVENTGYDFSEYNYTKILTYIQDNDEYKIQSILLYPGVIKENGTKVSYILYDYNYAGDLPNVDYVYNKYEYTYNSILHSSPDSETDLIQSLFYYIPQLGQPRRASLTKTIEVNIYTTRTQTTSIEITEETSLDGSTTTKTTKTTISTVDELVLEVEGHLKNPDLNVCARLGIINYDFSLQNNVSLILEEGSILINPKYEFRVNSDLSITFTELQNSDWIDAGQAMGPTNSNYKYHQVFPRIRINSSSLKDSSNLLSLVYDSYNLTMYSDYSVLNRHGIFYINPKINVLLLSGIVNSLETSSIVINNGNILLGAVKLYYSLSNADTAIYLDAIQVLKLSAYPKVSYEISVNIMNLNFVKYDYNKMGYIAHINDNELKFENVMGYISLIHLKLDKPWEDEVVIKNYKTKFLDLFSRIVASTLQMRKNEYVIGLASDAFSKDGTISSLTLSDSIMKVDLNYAFNNGKLTINLKDGIWGTSDSGVVAFRGGGIFTATTKNSDGNWIWNTGITPEGINADLITTGQLDTSRIKIYSGSRLRFQWNGLGLYAYKSFKLDIDVISSASPEVKLELNNYLAFETDGYSTNLYVKFTLNGLFLMASNGATVYSAADNNYKTLNREVTRVEISWQGLKLRNWNNELVFYADPDTGNLVLSGTIYANMGKIGGFTIGDKYLSTNNKSSFLDSFGVTGVYLGNDGIALGGGQFSVNSSGYLVAHEGFIGNWRLSKGILYSVPDGNNNEPDWEQGIVLNAAGSNLSSNQIYTIWAGAEEPLGKKETQVFLVVDTNGNPIYDTILPKDANGNLIYLPYMNGLQQVRHPCTVVNNRVTRINNVSLTDTSYFVSKQNYYYHVLNGNNNSSIYYVYPKNKNNNIDYILDNNNYYVEVYIAILKKELRYVEEEIQTNAPFRLKRNGDLYTNKLYANEVYSLCLKEIPANDPQSNSTILPQYVSIGNLFALVSNLKNLGLSATTSSNGKVTLSLVNNGSKTVNFNSAGSVYVSNVSGDYSGSPSSTQITINATITLSNNKVFTNKSITFTPSGWTKGTFTETNIKVGGTNLYRVVVKKMTADDVGKDYATIVDVGDGSLPSNGRNYYNCSTKTYYIKKPNT